MATLPLTPVMMIDEVTDIDCQPDGAIITFESYGASVRVRMSRSQFTAFGYKCIRTINAMSHMEQVSAEIVSFPKKRRA